MRMIKFRVTEEEYQKLLILSKNYGACSANEFSRDIALMLLSKDEKKLLDNRILDKDYLSVNMRFNVDESTYKKISESAKKHSWSLSKEIRFRLNQTLSREPVMLDDEMKALRQMRNEIVRIGQNIYYVIAQRQLLSVNDAAMWEDIKRLNKLIADVKNKINSMALARANTINVKRG